MPLMGTTSPALVNQGYLPLAGGTMGGRVIMHGPTIDAAYYGFLTTSSAQQNVDALRNAVNEAPSTGAAIYLPRGVYDWKAGDANLAAALQDREYLHIGGDGSGQFPYGGVTYTKGTVLKVVSGTGLAFDWQTAGLTQSARGNGLDGITFDCNSTATGVKLASHYSGIFNDVAVLRHTGTGLTLTTNSMSGVDDFQNSIFLSLLLSSGLSGAKGLVCDGGTPGIGNTSLNTFLNTFVFTADGTGIEYAYSDSNRMFGVICNCTGAAIGVDFLGSNSSGDNATHNLVYDIDAVGGVYSRGAGLTFPAMHNVVYFSGANAPDQRPVIETGSVLHYSNTLGLVMPEYRVQAEVRDDFMVGGTTSGTLGELGWQTNGVGTFTVGNALGHPGYVRVDTTSSSGTYVCMGLGPNGSPGMLSSETFDFTFVVRLNTNDSNVQVRIGIFLNYTDGTSESIHFEKLFADTQWFGVTRNASTDTRTSALASVSTNFVTLRARRIPGTGIGFTVNGGTEAVNTTNIPSTNTQPCVEIKNNAAAAKTIDVDYFYWGITGLARTGV